MQFNNLEIFQGYLKLYYFFLLWLYCIQRWMIIACTNDLLRNGSLLSYIMIIYLTALDISCNIYTSCNEDELYNNNTASTHNNISK